MSVLSDELGKDGASSTVRMAAGLALKNSLTSKEQPKQSRLRSKWLQGVNPDVRKQVKEVALETLGAKDRQAAAQAAQLVAAIATIEIPQNEWPELMPQLVHKVGTGPDNLKISSLITIGFITESEDQDLRRSLFVLSSAILTAVVQGARKDEPNDDVRLAAMQALAESLDFVEQNMEDEGERNFILQVVCEATQAENDSIKQSAFGCLNKIVGLYYRHMPFYMEKALYGLTIEGMKNEDEDVAKLAVEFWCTVCEEEWGLLEASRAVSCTQIHGGDQTTDRVLAAI